MIYHFITGQVSAARLQEAMDAEPSMAGKIICLEDPLQIGPLKKEEGGHFRALRERFYQELTPDKFPGPLDEMDRLLAVSGEMYKDTGVQAWFWMAPDPADVCAYFWLLPYLSKHPGRFYILPIAGLPFLDENGKLFYPLSFREIPVKEMIKARKLARPVTPAETETDIEEWERLLREDGSIRTLEGGRKITSRPASYYDSILLDLCSEQMQKAGRVIRQAFAKYKPAVPDFFLAWRLRQMIREGILSSRGNTDRPVQEWEVQLTGAAGEGAQPAQL